MAFLDDLATGLGGSLTTLSPEQQRDALSLALLTSGLTTLSGAPSQGLGSIAPGLLSGLDTFGSTLDRVQQHERRDRALDLEQERIDFGREQFELDKASLEQQLADEQEAAALKEFINARIIKNTQDGYALLDEIAQKYPDNTPMQVHLGKARMALGLADAGDPEGAHEMMSPIYDKVADLAEKLDKGEEADIPDRTELALIASRGVSHPTLSPQDAMAALELMGRRPTATQQQVEPYVEALRRGQMSISTVPVEVRDEVLAAAHSQDVQIITDEERKRILELRKVEPIFNAIADLSEKINTAEGPVARLKGSFEELQAAVNLSDDVAEYVALVMGFTPLVARAVGHTGVLTEADVLSTRELFPRPGDSKAVRDRKVARLRQIYGAIQSATEESILEPVGALDPLSTQELLQLLED